MSETPQEYLARIGSKGGKKSRRKLTKKEARRIAKVRWAAGAGRGAVKASKQSGAGSATVLLSDPRP
jgi:NAD(P)H-hydrate repair Nnr-like enzyme with NAD(P)H-hydrate dehydratase domain